MTTALNQANLTRLATAAKMVKRLKKNPMNPADWQNLGKLLGWKNNILSYYQPLGDENSSSVLVSEASKAVKHYAGFYPTWQWMAHYCFDWIMEGKDPDLFFKELLK